MYSAFFFFIKLFFCLLSSFNALAQNENERSYRLHKALNRLTSPDFIPAFSDSFVLTDVTPLKVKSRLFADFHGGLSGMAISAIIIRLTL